MSFLVNMFVYGNKNKFISLLSRRFVVFLSTFSREFYLDNLFLRQSLFNKKHNITTRVLYKKNIETKRLNLLSLINFWQLICVANAWDTLIALSISESCV